MDRRVSQPVSQQTRSFPNDLDGRSFPLMGFAPRDRSLIFSATPAVWALFRSRACQWSHGEEGVRRASSGSERPLGALVGEDGGDADAQLLRHLVAALAGDQQLELGLEVERVQTRTAFLEVALDMRLALGRELAVEEVIEGVDRLLTLHTELEVVVHSHLSRSATSPRRIPKSYNAFCNAFLHRCNRLMTVPMGTWRIWAISLYEKPSTSASSTAIRNCSGRASSARFTSSSAKRSMTSSSALRPAAAASSPPRRP